MLNKAIVGMRPDMIYPCVADLKMNLFDYITINRLKHYKTPVHWVYLKYSMPWSYGVGHDRLPEKTEGKAGRVGETVEEGGLPLELLSETGP